MLKKVFAASFAIGFACALFAGAGFAQSDKKTGDSRAQVHSDVQAAIANYRKTDPGIDAHLKGAAGYVVFPRVGKVGLIIGGGHGDGELFEKGKVTGVASVSLANVGLQAGIQEFSEIIVFKEQAALDRFKQNKFEFAATVSAVIWKAGASKDARYNDGVAVFARPSRGAMAEASVGTQKFNYKPDAGK